MKRELGVFFGIIVLLAVSLHYVLDSAPPEALPEPGEEVTIDEFRDILSGSERASTLMHLGPDNEKNRIVINCAVGIAQSMGALGMDVTNYGFENGYCIMPDLTQATQSECVREMSGTYIFEVGYGGGSTKFYQRKAVIYVDETFGGECSISIPGQEP
jgi:hypothetical protein